MSRIKPYALVLKALVLLSAWPAAGGPAPDATPRPGSMEWLDLDGARPIACPHSVDAGHPFEAPTCLSADVPLKRFKKHLRRQVGRASRRVIAWTEGWSVQGQQARTRVAVQSSYFDVIHADGGALIALIPVPPCLEPAPDVLSAHDVDVPPRRNYYARPRFPDAARISGESGSVMLQAVIGPQGTVREVCVLSGSENDPFARAATDAVRQWRYEPATVAGRPVAVLFTVSVRFSIGG